MLLAGTVAPVQCSPLRGPRGARHHSSANKLMYNHIRVALPCHLSRRPFYDRGTGRRAARMAHAVTGGPAWPATPGPLDQG